MSMSKLDPRIEAVRKEYDLRADDFWQIPQNKQWVCKHAALEIVAVKAKVEWSPPMVIEANTENGIAVLSVTGRLGERAEWATGEASPKNNRNTYPWAMAEKRAKDRVVLKLVGIHGLVYSEDEMPSGAPADPTGAQEKAGAPEPQQAPADSGHPSYASMKESLKQMQADLLDCMSIVTVEKAAEEWRAKVKAEHWPDDYKATAADYFKQARDRVRQQTEEAA